MNRYFEIQDDVNAPGRWWLGQPYDAFGQEINADSLTVGQKLNAIDPLKISLQYKGAPLDFTFGAFDVPVVNRRTLELLSEFAADTFQWFSAKIEGHDGDFAVVNFLQIRKCIDESKSEFLKWTANDHRADKAGQYRQVTKLRVDPKLVGNCDIFRLWGWDVALIVSERIERAFIDHRVSGVRFFEV